MQSLRILIDTFMLIAPRQMKYANTLFFTPKPVRLAAPRDNRPIEGDWGDEDDEDFDDRLDAYVIPNVPDPEDDDHLPDDDLQ